MTRPNVLVCLTLVCGLAVLSEAPPASAQAPVANETHATYLALFGEVVSASSSGYDLVYQSFDTGVTTYGHTDILFSAGMFVGNDFSKQYLIEASTGDLYTATIATGDVRRVGPTGMHGTATNLRWQYVSNRMIAADPAPDCSSTSIYMIDPATAAATLSQVIDDVCVTSLAIAYAPNVPGTIYAADTNGVLYTLATPAATLQPIGPVGFGPTPPAPMDFTDQGILCIFNFGEGGGVYVIDTTTGSAQLIGVSDTIYGLAYGFAPTDDVFVDGFEAPQR